jgi:hypothetical protein
MMNNVSSVAMIMLIVTVVPWVQVASSGEGFENIEKIVSRMYLENYKEILDTFDHLIRGNLWALIAPLKNGNMISLTLYGFSLFYSLYSLANFTPKTLLRTLLSIFLLLSTFGLNPTTLDPFR